MKKLINYPVMIIVSCLMSVLISSCGLKDREVRGYISEDQKPFYTWVETRPGSNNWECRPQVMVILEKGDTVLATFSQGSFAGSFALRYRDSYPPAVGNKIYVRMSSDGEVYYIFDASPVDLTTKRVPVGVPAWHD